MCISFNNDSPMVLCPREKYVNVVLFSKFCESFYPPLAMECILCCVFSCRFWDLRDEAKNTIGPNSHTWLLWWKRTGWTITKEWYSCILITHLILFSQKTNGCLWHISVTCAKMALVFGNLNCESMYGTVYKFEFQRIVKKKNLNCALDTFCSSTFFPL